MKKHELENCPQWLLDADTLNEDVRWHSSDNTILVWEGGYFRGGEFLGGYFRGGEFLGGEFRGGYFRGGEFRGGYFLGGEFRGGEFRGGYFRGGEFLGGEFRGGEFRGGYFLGGEFLGGEFLGGEFLGGEFRGGYFLGGEFLGGYFLGGYFLGGEFLGGEFLGFTPSKKWTVKVFKNGEIGIGCKTKTIKAWDRWFEGDEEFSSPRNSEDFKYIKSHWELCKAYLFFLRDFEPSHPVIKVVKFD